MLLLHVEMQIDSRTAGADWSEGYLQDGADRVQRWEVEQQIRRAGAGCATTPSLRLGFAERYRAFKVPTRQ